MPKTRLTMERMENETKNDRNTIDFSTKTSEPSLLYYVCNPTIYVFKGVSVNIH